MSNIYTVIAERWVTHNEIKKELLNIRAEIDSYCSENRDRNDGLYIAMKIIDKHIKGVDE